MGFTYILLQFCSCISDTLPSHPSPLCGLIQSTGGQGQQQQQQQPKPVKTNTQNPFGAPKNESICWTY